MTHANPERPQGCSNGSARTWRSWQPWLLLLSPARAAARAARAVPASLGHRDFHPSVERPVGLAIQNSHAAAEVGREEDSRLETRIASFETAFRMQADAADAFDISRESPERCKLYGPDDKVTRHYGSECLMARRLVEHGATDGFGWDALNDIVHAHDLHDTILHLMSLHHERLTWRHAKRDYRLTDVSALS